MPIRRNLMSVIMLTTGIALLLTCLAFYGYEVITFRNTLKEKLSTLGAVIAFNSTAAVAFDSPEDANEILHALHTEKNIVAACIYDENGKLFARYQKDTANVFPAKPGMAGYRFNGGMLEGFQPIIQQNQFIGTLYLKSDTKALTERLVLYAGITVLFIIVSFFLAYLISKFLQRSISDPILSLTRTARMISEDHDYKVRAEKTSLNELGVLTDAFNHMLSQIESQNKEILLFNQVLEQRVIERTNELRSANAELAVVNEKLTKSNYDLEQFAYIASHDLQEPLRKVQTFSDLVERNISKEDAAKIYLSKIKASAERMAALINAVLNYSRLSKMDTGFEKVDLDKIIENIKTDFELVVQEKNAKIEHGDLPEVYGISLQLSQLFSNLISNSLKFSKADPVITITSKTVSGEKITSRHPDANTQAEYVEIVFRDNGIGFEQEYAEKIFTLFQRLHDKQKYPGTGIGLALCKKIVENHQGFIDVDSELGKGTTFIIHLPAGKSQAALNNTSKIEQPEEAASNAK